VKDKRYKTNDKENRLIHWFFKIDPSLVI